jgi:hypothetical protein
MPRQTKAELEQENVELRDKLSEIYDELGTLIGVDDEGEDEDEEPEED